MAIDTKDTSTGVTQKTGDHTPYAPAFLSKLKQWLPYGEMPADLAAQNPITPKADPVPTTGGNSRGARAANNTKTDEEVHEIAAHHDKDFHNDVNPANQATVDQETIHQRSLDKPVDNEDDRQQEKSGSWWLADTLGIAAIEEAGRRLWHHHHWLRDLRILKDLLRIGRGAHRAEKAERAKRDERLAKDGEKLGHDERQITKDAKRIDAAGDGVEGVKRDLHDLNAGGKAAQDLRDSKLIGKEGHLADEIFRVGRLGETLKHIATGVGIVGVGGALGFVAKRVIEGEIVYNLALQSHPDKAAQWRDQVLYRSLLTKDATAEWNKGDYFNALKLEVQDEVNDVKSLVAYLQNKEKVKKDFAAAQDGYQALQTIYAKDPQTAMKLVAGLAQDLGLFADMGLKNGDMAGIMHGLFMGDQEGAMKMAQSLGTQVLSRPGVMKKAGGQLGQVERLKNLVNLGKADRNGPIVPQPAGGASPTNRDNLG